MPMVTKNSKQPNCKGCDHGQFVREIRSESKMSSRSKVLAIAEEYLCTHPDEGTAFHYNRTKMSSIFPCKDSSS